MNPQRRLESIARALSIPTTRRHVFLCAMQTTPKCSDYDTSAEVWRYLKKRLKELGVTSAPPAWQGGEEAEPCAPGGGSVLRTKVDCLRICEQGPIAVVYPEGIWYRGVTIEVMEKIITSHLVGGEPVWEYVFARTGSEVDG